MASAVTLSAPEDAESLWVPREENVLPLPWADFHEMYQRRSGTDSDLMETNGTLRIEGKCLYLDELPAEQYRPHDEQRWVLALPNDLIQYDETSGELWFHRRIHVLGPFLSGDEVVASDISWRRARSSECGNHRIISAGSIDDCPYLSDKYRRACSVAAYSATHGWLPDEASRRLDRIVEMEAVLAELREVDPHRTAGWGVDQADLYTKIGDSFVAWLWLTGDDPPSQELRKIAAEHPDVEIRTGASTSYEALHAAQEAFAKRTSVDLPLVTLGSNVDEFDLSRVVAWTWINHRSNVLEIGIDRRWIPHEVASVLLTGDPDAYDDSRWPPENELYAKIAEVLRDHIDVPFVVAWGLIDGEP
ncbi:MAG: hypothetical protein OXH86_01795 [Acidimicrobiaceae bacterium]|nr:hypothetical protein [Acidimicrobiaceae bacterium]